MNYLRCYHRLLTKQYNVSSFFLFSTHNRWAEQCDRNPKFSKLTANDILHFRSIIGKTNVKTCDNDNDNDDLSPFNTDFMKWFHGTSKCILLPENEQQVSAILKHCHERTLAVVPQAGNTGLVGGSVPVFDEVVLSIKKINKKYTLDTTAGILHCDAGFILEELDGRLAKEGYMMPLDLGSKGSCLIGGNVASNAGGIRYVRYGSMHANVLALRVVLADADGSILQLGSNYLRKDNSDLHTKNLFIGSEGQFGVITEVSIVVPPRPESIHSAFLGTTTFSKCCEVLRLAKKMLNEILSSFELMDRETMECIEENAKMANVLEKSPRFNLLVETSGSNTEHDSAKMEHFLSHCLETGLIEDGILAGTVADANYMWKLREQASLSLIQDGYVYKHDLSLPLEHFYELTDVIRQRLGGKAKRVVGFGHMGDGNNHINITTQRFDEGVYDLLYPFIYDWTAAHGGSISAEHGIGRLKRSYHLKLCSPKKKEINRALKRVFDPKGILSPYKLIG